MSNTIRNWMNLFESEKLTEATDYTLMLSGLVSDLENGIRAKKGTDGNVKSTVGEDVAAEIKWAKANLKREDRIVWYLRIYKLSWVQESQWIPPETAQKYVSDYNKKSPIKIDHGFCDKISITRLKTGLTHYLSLPIPAIQNLVFSWQYPSVLFDQMGKFEEEYMEQKKRLIPMNEDDKPVIKFTDGFAWVLLDRSYCRVEGDAMGHCGNAGDPKSGDRVLSLRKKVVIGNDGFWEPFLTFILMDDGYLSEMKGRGNDKPAKRYHPYIIKLLESDMIKGIVGGGYMPENNFSLSDLDDEEKERLLELKPDLDNDIFSMYELGTDNPRFIHALQQVLNNCRGHAEIEDDHIVLASYRNFDDFKNGEGIESPSIDSDDLIKTILDQAHPETMKTLRKYLEENYPKEFAEITSQHWENVDVDQLAEEISSLLTSQKDPVLEQLLEKANEFMMSDEEVINIANTRGYTENGIYAHTVKNEDGSVVIYIEIGDFMNEMSYHEDEHWTDFRTDLEFSYFNNDYLNDEAEDFNSIDDTEFADQLEGILVGLIKADDKDENQGDLFNSYTPEELNMLNEWLEFDNE